MRTSPNLYTVASPSNVGARTRTAAPKEVATAFPLILAVVGGSVRPLRPPERGARRVQTRAAPRAPTPTRPRTNAAGGEAAPSGRNDAAGAAVRVWGARGTIRIDGGTGEIPASAPVMAESGETLARPETGLSVATAGLSGDAAGKAAGPGAPAAAGAGAESDVFAVSKDRWNVDVCDSTGTSVTPYAGVSRQRSRKGSRGT